MSRVSKPVTIVADNRDNGKVFLITEKPASASEKWAIRASAAVAKAGFDMPADASWPALVALGFQAFLSAPWADVEPLLDELFDCVERVPDPTKPQVTRPLVESDIEEISTRVKLRDEVFNLHSGFSIADALSLLKAPAPGTAGNTFDTQTSQET